jgi:hypothetical protein
MSTTKTEITPDGAVEKTTYIESEDKMIVETIYDPTDVIEENAALRQREPVTIGSKGQRMVLAMRLPMEHVLALKNEGYDILSADPEVSRRAMLYVQANQQKFLTTDRKMIAERRQIWQ